MGQYRKKPVMIEAFKWTGGPDQTEDPEWIVVVMAQAACAMAEIAGMQAENQVRIENGASIMYREEAFDGVITRYTIGHNDVMALFQN